MKKLPATARGRAGGVDPLYGEGGCGLFFSGVFLVCKKEKRRARDRGAASRFSRPLFLRTYVRR
jgi:hypothetical protein